MTTTTQSREGWKVLAALWLILAITMGCAFYGASVINAAMSVALKFDRSQLGGASAVFQWMSGLPGPLVAVCIQRKGARFTLVVGSLTLIAGAIGMSLWVHTGLEFTLFYGIIVGLAAVIAGPLPSQVTVTRWFIRHRARAVALLLTAPAVGGFVSAPLFNYVITAAGGNWRAGWWLIAAGGVLSTVLALLLVKNAPESINHSGEAVNDPMFPVGGAETGLTISQILRKPAFWQMLAAMCGIFTGFGLFTAHAAIHLQDVGFSSAQAASAMSLAFLAVLGGNVAFGLLGDYVQPRYLLAAASMLFATGLILVVAPSGPLEIYLFALLVGSGFGLGLSTMMVLPSNHFGDLAYGPVIGIILAISTTAEAVGSYGAGYTFDHFGSYKLSLQVVAGLCAIGALLAIFLPRPVRNRA